MNKPIGTGWEIDWGHPLARGLRFTITDTDRDLVSNDLSTSTVGTLTYPEVKEGASSIAVPLTLGNYLYYEDPANLNSNLAFTTFSLVHIESISTNHTVWQSGEINTYDSLDDALWVDNLGFNSGGTNCVSYQFAGQSRLESPTDSAIPGEYNKISTVRKLNSQKLYVNDTLTSSAASTNGSTSSNRFRVGGIINTLSGLGGNIALMCIWNRDLSPTEIKSLHENPYQFLKQRKSINTNELSTLLAPMPTANDDTDEVDRGVSDTVTGNVLTNDDITCP